MTNGSSIVTRPSRYSVQETLDRLEAILREKGAKVFARVDHSGEAMKVGMKMNPTQLLVFGDPRAGTPVMREVPLAALDLPLRALAWQDGEGRVWLSYNEPVYYRQRFGLNDAVLAGIAGAVTLIEKALL